MDIEIMEKTHPTLPFKSLECNQCIFQENKLAAKKIKLLTDRIKAEKDAEKKRFAGKLFG